MPASLDHGQVRVQFSFFYCFQKFDCLVFGMDVFQGIISHVANNIYGIAGLVIALANSRWIERFIAHLKIKSNKNVKELCFVDPNPIMRSTYFLQGLIKHALMCIIWCIYACTGFILAAAAREMGTIVLIWIATSGIAVGNAFDHKFQFNHLVRSFFKQPHVNLIKTVNPANGSDDVKPVVD